MFTLDITHNIEEAKRGHNAFFRSQVPFATSVALNKTIKDVRFHIIRVTWRDAFTVRNKAFPGRVFRMKFSRKQDLEVILRDQMALDYLVKHAEGGVKTPKGGGKISIPTAKTGRTATGRVAAAKRRRVVLGKKNVVQMRTKGGEIVVRHNRDGSSDMLYNLIPQARIKKTFRFEIDATKTAERVMNRHWNAAMIRAAKTSKFYR